MRDGKAFFPQPFFLYRRCCVHVSAIKRCKSGRHLHVTHIFYLFLGLLPCGVCRSKFESKWASLDVLAELVQRTLAFLCIRRVVLVSQQNQDHRRSWFILVIRTRRVVATELRPHRKLAFPIVPPDLAAPYFAGGGRLDAQMAICFGLPPRSRLWCGAGWGSPLGPGRGPVPAPSCWRSTSLRTRASSRAREFSSWAVPEGVRCSFVVWLLGCYF